MKIPFFLRSLVFWAVGDSEGAPPRPSMSASEILEKSRSYYPVLLLPTPFVGYWLVKAEEHGRWAVAQACLVSIMVLLALAAWCWWQAENKTPDLSVKAAIYHRALEKLLWCVAVGMVAMITVAARKEHWVYGIVARAIAYGILTAGFSFISGVLLGYIFGLHPTDSSKKLAGQTSGSTPPTNLVEIADWFTKIILGVGLVQLTSLHAPIWRFANVIAVGVVLGDEKRPYWELPNPAMALAIMGFFSTCGLLYGYLWTRYEDAVTSYGAGDATAAALVNHWLNGQPTPDDQTRLDMIEAVKNASSTARMRIYLQAEQYRKSSTEEINERSLPVFQALVEADSEGVFHRNRGQCALALMGKTKDPKNPVEDRRRALDLLNDAIRIRDSSGEPGWHEYEFARAVCQITLDPSFKTNQPWSPQAVQSIRADIEQAKDVPNATKNVIDKDQVVTRWESLIAPKAA